MLVMEEHIQSFEQEEAMNFFKVATKIFSFLYCKFLKVKTAVFNTENASTQYFPKECNSTRNYSK